MRTLLIHLNDDLTNASCIGFDESHTITLEPTHGSLSEISKHAHDHNCILLTPGQNINIYTPQIPVALKQARMATAIPFALEDQLGEELEQLHFAIGSRGKDELVPVAVVNHQQMQALKKAWHVMNIHPQLAIPDYLALPIQRKHWTIAFNHENNTALVRINHHRGFSVHQNTLLTILQLKLAETVDKPVCFDVYNDSQQLLSTETINQESIDIQQHTQQSDLLPLFIKGLRNKTSINLLHGNYSATSTSKQNQRLGNLAIGLVALCLITLFVGQLGQLFYFKHQQGKLDKEIATSYRKAYPNATSVVSPKLRVEQELKTLKSSIVANEFFILLSSVGKLIHNTPEIQLKQIEYKLERLNIQLELDSFERLESLTSELTKLDLNVKREQASSKDQAVIAQLSISRKSS